MKTARKRPRGILYGGNPQHERMRTPSYPNWQRKRIQNPYSVSSNLTEGTSQTPSSRRVYGRKRAICGDGRVWAARA